MTKDEVKTLGEGDDQLQWWAMVLFAEVCELVEVDERDYDGKSAYTLIKGKVRDFQRIVYNRMVDVAKGNLESRPSLEGRIKKLEDWKETFA